MNLLFRLLAVVLAAAFAAALPAADAPPAYAIPNTQVRALPRAANGRDYLLYVAVPASYAKETQKRYPVVYITDGYWDFQLLAPIHGSLFYDKVAPEFIIVGIGYPGENPDYDKLRRYDLTPVADATMGADATATGHAAEFLGVIEQEMIPFIEREYRVDPSFRVLGGSSLGGLFSIYTMLSRPGLFQAHIAVSPAVGWGDDWLFRQEEAYAKGGRPLPARLFVSGAADEWPFFIAAILRFNAQMQTRSYEGFTYQWRLVEGARHSGTKPEGFTRGLIFALAPLAPKVQ